jgi:hypothetical protein
MSGAFNIPKETVGFRLYRIDARERLIACEALRYDSAAVVDTLLRRALISGRVEVGGKIENHFLDLLDADCSMVETVALDRHSYSALKNHWARCKLDHELNGE